MAIHKEEISVDKKSVFQDPIELIDLASFSCKLGWQKYDGMKIDTLFMPQYAEIGNVLGLSEGL